MPFTPRGRISGGGELARLGCGRGRAGLGLGSGSDQGSSADPTLALAFSSASISSCESISPIIYSLLGVKSFE